MLEHGPGADIFALIAVFCEMFTVIKGFSVHYFHEFLCTTADTEVVRLAAFPSSIVLYGRSTSRIKEYFVSNLFFEDYIGDML
jgi:hypothetical protein